ncbi:MAG: hypothetical protein B7Z66_08155 [Chromatiales bacterium 21-64-14]|nr:MAG: hypothetical protein B7Z66_08155 [Chromatiales bacterium 21-64-14]HQU15309.1 hypothetical protein [Gammaproteobacteria bacterium]
MHIVVIVAAGCSAVFTLLTVAGLIRPRFGLARTQEQSLIRNGALALVAYLVLAVALGAGDPNQKFLTPGAVPLAPSASANPPAAVSQR